MSKKLQPLEEVKEVAETVAEPMPTDLLTLEGITEQKYGELIPETEPRLREIAMLVRTAHEQVQALFRRQTPELARIGAGLLEAQAKVNARGKVGQGFENWVPKNCGFAVSTAYNYMKIYRAVKLNPNLLSEAPTVLYKRVNAAIQTEKPTPPSMPRMTFNRGKDFRIEFVALKKEDLATIDVDTLVKDFKETLTKWIADGGIKPKKKSAATKKKTAAIVKKKDKAPATA